jgi:hypothetical protein
LGLDGHLTALMVHVQRDPRIVTVKYVDPYGLIPKRKLLSLNRLLHAIAYALKTNDIVMEPPRDDYQGYSRDQSNCGALSIAILMEFMRYAVSNFRPQEYAVRIPIFDWIAFEGVRDMTHDLLVLRLKAEQLGLIRSQLESNQELRLPFQKNRDTPTLRGKALEQLDKVTTEVKDAWQRVPGNRLLTIREMNAVALRGLGDMKQHILGGLTIQTYVKNAIACMEAESTGVPCYEVPIASAPLGRESLRRPIMEGSVSEVKRILPQYHTFEELKTEQFEYYLDSCHKESMCVVLAAIVESKYIDVVEAIINHIKTFADPGMHAFELLYRACEYWTCVRTCNYFRSLHYRWNGSQWLCLREQTVELLLDAGSLSGERRNYRLQFGRIAGEMLCDRLLADSRRFVSMLYRRARKDDEKQEVVRFCLSNSNDDFLLDEDIRKAIEKWSRNSLLVTAVKYGCPNYIAFEENRLQKQSETDITTWLYHLRNWIQENTYLLKPCAGIIVFENKLQLDRDWSRAYESVLSLRKIPINIFDPYDRRR